MYENPPTIERVAETTLSEFEIRLRDKAIVIIYPRHRGRSALVSMFLDVYQDSLLYYRLEESDDTFAHWIANISSSDVFPPGFGQQTQDAIKAKAEPEELAEAFGADLHTLPNGATMLLLDAFDQMAPTEEVERFFGSLPPHMPAHLQIVINARLLRVQPWNDLIHAGQAAVVGDETAMGGSIYGDDPAKGQLEVHSLSGGYVYIDGRPVMSWDGSLPKHLFYYFVDHPMVTRDEIFEVFWPKMNVKEATNVFHVTKRKISERLGYELTNYSGGFYIHSPRLTIHYDAKLFEDAVQTAIEAEQVAPVNWQTAVQLYRSDYLPYIHTPWVEARRAEMKNKYAQALIGLGRYHRSMNELDQALGYLLRALREKPDWEDVHQDVMMIYHQQGRRNDAVAQYKQLEKTLKKMFNITPSKETVRLYNMVRTV